MTDCQPLLEQVSSQSDDIGHGAEKPGLLSRLFGGNDDAKDANALANMAKITAMCVFNPEQPTH